MLRAPHASGQHIYAMISDASATMTARPKHGLCCIHGKNVQAPVQFKVATNEMEAFETAFHIGI